jgi:hypothetical protein
VNRFVATGGLRGQVSIERQDRSISMR